MWTDCEFCNVGAIIPLKSMTAISFWLGVETIIIKAGAAMRPIIRIGMRMVVMMKLLRETRWKNSRLIISDSDDFISLRYRLVVVLLYCCCFRPLR